MQSAVAIELSQPCRSLRPASLGLFLITVVVYLSSLFGGFIWDDDVYVEHNLTLRSFGGLWHIWSDLSANPQFYPLVHTTFWIEFHLWGAHWAFGYHLDNVLLHGLVAVLLWRLLRQLEINGAWIIAAIFAVHPVNVESVAWITERKNVLSGVFYFLAFGTYLKSIEFSDNSIRKKVYATALGFFVLALLSKTVTATLPSAVLIVLWWKRGQITVKDVIRLLPFFVIGIAMGALTGHIERTQVGAAGGEWAQWGPIERILIAGRAIWFYAFKLVAPIQLSFIYSQWRIDRHQVWQFAFPIGAMVVVTILWLLRRRIGRGPVIAVLFFIGTLFPALGFINVYPMRYSFVADHFQYLASIGLIALAVGVATTTIHSSAARRAVALAVLIFLSVLTFERCFVYHDRITLWRDTVAENPQSWMAHTNLGHALHSNGDDPGAWEQYKTALALAPNIADTHFNFGIGLAIHDDLKGAIHEFHRAIEIDPNYVPAYANSAKALLEQGKPQEAMESARQAVQRSPRYPLGHLELARALEQLDRLPEAANEYAIAVALDPENVDAHLAFAQCLRKIGRTDQAMAEYQAAQANKAGR